MKKFLEYIKNHTDGIFIGVVFTVAILGIIAAIIGHYATAGFSLGWFLGLDLPLYVFCGWALWQAWKMWTGSKKKEVKHD